MEGLATVIFEISFKIPYIKVTVYHPAVQSEVIHKKRITATLNGKSTPKAIFLEKSDHQIIRISIGIGEIFYILADLLFYDAGGFADFPLNFPYIVLKRLILLDLVQVAMADGVTLDINAIFV